MIQSLIWDVDGTLLDTYPAIVAAMLTALACEGGSAPYARVDALCKVSFGYAVATLAAEADLAPERLLVAFHRALDQLPLGDQRPFPGVRELCAAAIAAGGANFVLTHRQRGELDRLLCAHGLTHLFSDSVAGDDGFPRKPDPAGLLDLCARNRLESSRALVIGDRELDILAAHRAGLRACLYGANPCAEPPEFLIVDYADLLEQMRRENVADTISLAGEKTKEQI